MIPKSSKKHIALCISLILLLSQICHPVTVYATGTEDKTTVDNVFSASSEAQKIFASKKIIKADELSKDHVFNNGLSIIVGNNIDVNVIKAKTTDNYSSSVIDQQKKRFIAIPKQRNRIQ